jgi:hypothetical protein
MSMNLYQRFNVTATFAVAVSISNGISAAFTRSPLLPDPKVTCSDAFCLSGNYDLFLLAIFSLLFNFKACFENYYFFVKTPVSNRAKLWRFSGFIIGLLSWITWIISGSITFMPQKSALWLALTIFISTLWIFHHLGELWVGGKEDVEWGKRVGWLLCNLAYFSILLMYAYGIDIYMLNIPKLSLLYIVLIADYFVNYETIGLIGYSS